MYMHVHCTCKMYKYIHVHQCDVNVASSLRLSLSPPPPPPLQYSLSSLLVPYKGCLLLSTRVSDNISGRSLLPSFQHHVTGPLCYAGTYLYMSIHMHQHIHMYPFQSSEFKVAFDRSIGPKGLAHAYRTLAT